MMKPIELSRHAARAFLGAALIGVIFAGCARDGADQSVLGPAGDTTSLGADSGGADLCVKLPNRVKLTAMEVEGDVGGVVRNGRNTVTFTPHAFSGDAVITVESLSNADGSVELGPHGLTFDAPVILTINLYGTPWDSPHPTIEWYDPSTGTWVDMGGTYNPGLHSVSTVLPHFSTYRPRAGW